MRCRNGNEGLRGSGDDGSKSVVGVGEILMLVMTGWRWRCVGVDDVFRGTEWEWKGE